MKFARIEGAHIFNAGTWNGLPFTEADLDSIVNAFDQLSLAGRVPLKFGHNSEQPYTDGQPALGWVEKVYRRGGELLADFRDVPEVVFNAIKNGLYKFVSIELMRQQLEDGELSAPVVLDAVALLGAEKPAVSNLRDLQALTMSRRANVGAGERVVFTMADPAKIIQESRKRMDEEQMKARIAELEAANKAATDKATALEQAEKKRASGEHRAKLSAVFERGVKSEVITPAQRDKFTKMLGIDDDEKVMSVTVEDVEAFIGAGKPSTGTGKRASFSRSNDGDDDMSNEDDTNKAVDEVVVERIETFCRENRLNVEDVEQRRKARKAVFSKDPELAAKYMRLWDNG